MSRPRRPRRPADASRIVADLRKMIRARRLRDRFFDSELFADPAWDILLDLAIAGLEGRKVAVSSVCIAAAVPDTTALRHINTLVARGLVVRSLHRADRRYRMLSLTPRALNAVVSFMSLEVRQEEVLYRAAFNAATDAALADVQRAADRLQELLG